MIFSLFHYSRLLLVTVIMIVKYFTELIGYNIV